MKHFYLVADDNAVAALAAYAKQWLFVALPDGTRIGWASFRDQESKQLADAAVPGGFMGPRFLNRPLLSAHATALNAIYPSIVSNPSSPPNVDDTMDDLATTLSYPPLVGDVW